VVVKKIAYFCFQILLKTYLEDLVEGRANAELSLEGMFVLFEKSGSYLEKKEK
jgi:hypothetical protein